MNKKLYNRKLNKYEDSLATYDIYLNCCANSLHQYVNYFQDKESHRLEKTRYTKIDFKFLTGEINESE